MFTLPRLLAIATSISSPSLSSLDLSTSMDPRAKDNLSLLIPANGTHEFFIQLPCFLENVFIHENTVVPPGNQIDVSYRKIGGEGDAGKHKRICALTQTDVRLSTKNIICSNSSRCAEIL